MQFVGVEGVWGLPLGGWGRGQSAGRCAFLEVEGACMEEGELSCL